jgi:hypothetical protein
LLKKFDEAKGVSLTSKWSFERALINAEQSERKNKSKNDPKMKAEILLKEKSECFLLNN